MVNIYCQRGDGTEVLVAVENGNFEKTFYYFETFASIGVKLFISVQGASIENIITQYCELISLAECPIAVQNLILRDFPYLQDDSVEDDTWANYKIS